jgi:hypothetical protein
VKIKVSKFTRNVGVATALSALFATGITVALVTGTSGTTAGAVDTPGEQKARASAVLDVLGGGQSSDDKIPAEQAKRPEVHGESGLKLDSTRLISKGSTGSYYAGEDNSGNVCLLMFPRVGGGSMSACTKVENFVLRGVGATYENRDGAYTEAYLLPDGTDVTANSAGLKPHGKNLLVGDTRQVATDQRVQRLPTANGKHVEFALVSEDQSGSD